MEQSGQNLPPTLTPQPLTPMVIQETGAATNAEAQPVNPIVAEAEAVTANVTKPPLPKKRKPNASGPRKSSIAWDHFTKLPENEVSEPTAACNYCNKKYLCDPKHHGTSNLLSHLGKCPKYPFALINDPNQTTLNFKAGEGSSLVPASTRFNLEACKKALAVFVAMDEQPFKVVEGQGFKYLIKQLQPQFTPPSRRTVARHCYQMYLDEKTKLKALFRSDCSRVALTTDCWTSVQNLHYMALTAHFIDKDWKYQKKIISFSIIPNSKGDTIGRKVEEILREWGIRNVSCITTDNATSNDVAVAYLKKRIKNMNGLMNDGIFFHMRCCAHILNLVVNDGLKDIQNSISGVRNAVRFVRSSPQRSAKFKECIEFSGVTSKKLVCLDVPTRWNSTYLMLDAAEKFQLAFDKLEGEDPSYVEYFGIAGPPNTSDWENVRVFVKFLKIFYEATKIFSSSQEVSLHNAFHQMATIFCELKKCCMNLNTILATMVFEMQNKYDKYWGSMSNINQLLYFGIIFDPRYKLNYIDWSFEEMYSDRPEFAKELSTSLKTNLFNMYNWYKSTVEGQNSADQSSSSQSVGATQPVNLEKPITIARADAFKQHLREQNSIDKKNELERYLDEHCIDEGDKFDILNWWKENSSRFPIVSAMVREVLAIPVSSVASESVFSTGGRVLDTFRSSLNPKMAEALICAQNWMRPSISQFNDNYLNEEFEVSEAVITEFENGLRGPIITARAVGATPLGAAGVEGAKTSEGTAVITGSGPSSQSQPSVGCD